MLGKAGAGVGRWHEGAVGKKEPLAVDMEEKFCSVTLDIIGQVCVCCWSGPSCIIRSPTLPPPPPSNPNPRLGRVQLRVPLCD